MKYIQWQDIWLNVRASVASILGASNHIMPTPNKVCNLTFEIQSNDSWIAVAIMHNIHESICASS